MTNLTCLILAGGEGTRLKNLTWYTPKPLVEMGGCYSLIDFVLSNCMNSKAIKSIGVIIQYNSPVLLKYLEKYELINNISNFYILPPNKNSEINGEFEGTADAINKNRDFMKYMEEDHVLILSCDHVYNMDYDKFFKYHIENDADLTIATTNVSKEMASNFGVLTADEDNTIVSFEEKPENPKSTSISMGVYIFKTSVLLKELKEDMDNSNSTHDFGKDIIPKMINEHKNVKRYEFGGYWRDVGTLENFWQTNMDFINSKFNICKVNSFNLSAQKTSFIESLNVEHSLIGENNLIQGKISNSVLNNSIHVKEGSSIEDSVILSGAVIEEGVKVKKAIVPKGAIIAEDIGNGIDVVLADKAEIKEDYKNIFYL